MSNINKQALREAATKAKELGNISRYTKAMVARLEFKEAATPEAVLALLDELEAADKRIAELEAREVVLPQRISMEGGAYCTAHARYDEDGDYYYRDEVIESLVAAGIITKVGE